MKTLQERFDEKWTPEPTTGCWLWTGAIDVRGYGVIRTGKVELAHRVAFELAGVELIDGLVLDHTCRQRCCVNPAHLRQVTRRENTLAPGSLAPTAIHAAKTHCPRGHAYTKENTYVYKTHRTCRICDSARSARRSASARSQQ